MDPNRLQQMQKDLETYRASSKPDIATELANFRQSQNQNPVAQPPAVQQDMPNIPQQRADMQASGEGVSVNPDKAKPSFIGSLIRGVIKPIATLAARPVQLARAIGGATPEEQTIHSSYLGDIKPSMNAGDVIADVGRGVQTVAMGLGGGAAADAAGTFGKQTLGQVVKQTALKEAGIGAIGGFGSGLEQAGSQHQNLPQALGTLAENTALGGALGAGIGAVAPLAGSAYRSVFKGTQKSLDDLVGAVVQGKPEDIKTAKAALQNIDSKGIKTYSDLKKAIIAKIDAIAQKLDEAFATDTRKYTPTDFTQKTKVGKFNVTQNHINDALSQLETFYAKTNDPLEKARITQLKAQANNGGLTIKEINNIAKEHGRVLSGYNANGELASGLTQQAAENTRTGIKETGRKLFGNEAYATADKTMSDLIQTRDLISNMEEKVNALKQKVVSRGLGERVVRPILSLADKLTLGGVKGAVQYFIPSGAGLKTLDSIALEKALKGNLSKIESLLAKDAPNETILQALQDIVEGGAKKISKPSITPQSLADVQKSRSSAMRQANQGLRNVQPLQTPPAYQPVGSVQPPDVADYAVPPYPQKPINR